MLLRDVLNETTYACLQLLNRDFWLALNSKVLISS